MTYQEQAKALVAQMTLPEKASLCSGKNFWFTKGIPRLGLPEIMVTDGPHGLRKQEGSADQLGINKSVPAVCFPTASAIASSFDRALIRSVGQAIGEECRQEDVAVLLGPGVNIKRSPLCGRNFEYFSEDPLVSGEMAAAFIEGVQSQNVGVSLKHFAANNQETRRMVSESVIDERTLREIYLPAFERAVKQAKPWTLMCAYNLLFGEPASQNHRLLTEILRDEWGFEGLVMSDWGAVVERVKGVQAGLDLEMPHLNDGNDRLIIQAVENGSLSLADLDTAAERVTALILRSMERQKMRYSPAAHRALARRAAAESAVLLKNDGGLLPGNTAQSAAVIGAFARQPRYQGAGSSKIEPLELDSPLAELERLGLPAEYAPGYALDSDAPDEAMIAAACQAARDKDIVYLFAGLPDRYESESFDRDNMAMPANHVALIEAVCQVNPRTVVVLMGGAPMEMAWAGKVPAILLVYLGGEAVGGACADLLLGKVTPSGKLAESWPFAHMDAPSHGNFPGAPLTVEYREGLFVGYRYYDTAQAAVRYPFGYGLSYTQFSYGDLQLSAPQMRDRDELRVACTVTNTGPRPGSEVVQLYVAARDSAIIRPAHELRGFAKVYLQPGESQEVQFTLSGRDFSYYNVALPGWHVENGEYEIQVGASSRDIRLHGVVCLESTVEAPLPDMRAAAPGYYDLSHGLRISDADFAAVMGRPIPPARRGKGAPHTLRSTLTDIQDKWLGRMLWNYLNGRLNKMAGDNPDIKLMAEKMIPDMPLYFLPMMSSGALTFTQAEGLIEILNGRLFIGIRRLMQKAS